VLLPGLSLAALAAELMAVFALRRRGRGELVSREISELIISLGLFLVLLLFATYYAPPGTVGNALRNLAEAHEALGFTHKRLLSIAFGVAALSIILTFYLARGSYKLPDVLQSYAVNLDRLLGPLSSATSLAGIATALTRHAILLVELGANLRPWFEALLPALLVYRVRRFAAPIVALLFALSAVAPYAFSLRIPHVDPPLHFLEAPGKWGFASFDVRDRYGEVVYAPVLVALKDSDGRLYVLRVSHGYTVALPSGNYTALWVAVYFTRFDVPACCLDPKPYAYCSCPVWPAKLRLDNYSTLAIQVNLPVRLILCEQGVGGVFTAYRGGAPLPTSNLDCGAAVYVTPIEDEPAFITVKGGSYGVVFPSGRVPAGNNTCWHVNVTRLEGVQPGSEIDHDLLRRAREGYIFWWNSVKDAIAEHLRSLFELGSASTPKYMEYGLVISFHRGACTGEPVRVPFAEVILLGVCCWNDSHAVPYNPFWEEARRLADSLPPLAGDLARLSSLLYNSALLFVHWAAGVLAAAGLYAETLPYVVRALAEKLARGAKLVPLLSLKARRSDQQLWYAPKRSLRDEIEDALWERSTIKRFARVLYALTVYTVRSAASTLRSHAVPLALRSVAAASSSVARRAQRREEEVFGAWRRRSRMAQLAGATSRVARALYEVSTWPSAEHRLRAAGIIADTSRTLARLARVLIPETYYRIRGYKVLLPYSLGYESKERNFLAPREALLRYEMKVAPLVHTYLREVTDEVARRAPWVAARAEWKELEKALQEAKRLYELDDAIRLLLGMGSDVRKLVAKVTRVAPSPWMELDLALYLRLRALEELEKQGETWATFCKNLILWEPLLPDDHRPKFRHKLWKLKRGLRWRLGRVP